MNLKIKKASKSFCSPRTLGLGFALAAALLSNAQAQSPTVPDANVGLERSGPISPRHGYPEWYQDKTGLALELLTPTSAAELAAGYCVILPADTVYPEVLPTNWATEHFYWYAGSEINVPGRARIILAHEASFAGGAAKIGDQIVFTRVRIDFRSVPFTGTYIIETPYSTRTFTNVPAGARIFDTEDVGIAPPGPAAFDLSLKTKVGNYLVASSTPGGAELPPVNFGGRKYLADPTSLVKVTGSPLGANRNAFRIWFKANALSTAVLLGENTNFSLYGRIVTSDVPGRTSISRATKTLRTSPSADRRVDICAVAKGTLASRLPGNPYSTVAIPELKVYMAGAVNTNGVLSVPNGTAYTMARMGSEYSYQSNQFATRAAVPTAVTVTDNTGGVYTINTTDGIVISAATYNPNTASLTVTATSTDSMATLTVNTIDGPLTTTKAGSVYTATGVTAAPCDVIVTSNAGGVASLDVQVTKK